MKEYRSTGGQRKLWYEPNEIETIMQDELYRAGLLPGRASDDLTVDLEALVESHLKIPLDQYAKLDADVLGMTEFPPHGSPKISINADLTGAFDAEEMPHSRGRWRATLAHEVAHVLLHRSLFEIDDLQRGLFPPQESRPVPMQLMRCLKRGVAYRGGGADWREVQANMGMSALLMPREIFVPAVKEEKMKLGISDSTAMVAKDSHDGARLIAVVARRFSVSKEAAGIRLEVLGILSARNQNSLTG